MEIHLIRHTLPLIEKGICYGHSDISIGQSFQSDADAVLAQLPEDIDQVFSSPLERCIKLASLFKAQNDLRTDNRLKEMNFGEWEMKQWDQIDQRHLSNWMKDFVNYPTPAGESFVDLHERVYDFIKSELMNTEKETIVIVTHAGVIRSFICRMLDIPLHNAFKIPSSYMGQTKISFDKSNGTGTIIYLDKLSRG